jgi:hypothetical protein
MAEHSRVWSADDPNSPFAEGGAFKFAVVNADEVIARGSEHFVEEQAKAWQDIRSWADDQTEIVEVQKGGSPNGPGASLPLTENLRTELPKLLKRHHIRSMLDVACGDWNWMRYVDLTKLQNYYGWDVDPELVLRSRERAKHLSGRLAIEGVSTPFTHFEVRNIADTNFPNVDCILARHILIHFPNDWIGSILDKMRASPAKYLLTSNFPGETNEFIYNPAAYTWIGYMEHPVNLDEPPFSLSNKVDAIQEQTGPAGVLTYPHELALYRLRP